MIVFQMICVFVALIFIAWIANGIDEIIVLIKEIKVLKKDIVQLDDILKHWDIVSEYVI